VAPNIYRIRFLKQTASSSLRRLGAICGLVGLIALTWLWIPVYAQDEELLEPDKAFAFGIQATAADRIQVTWSIAKDYYMYRDKFRVRLEKGDATLGDLQIPPGKKKQDQFFGEVEIYEGVVRIDVPVQRQGAAPTSVVIIAEGQGCNEPIGVCYPPIKHTATLNLVAVPGESASPIQRTARTTTKPITSLSSLRDLLGGAGQQDEFLDPDQAFQFLLNALDADTLGVTFTIADGYYLYRDKTKFKSQTSGVRVSDYQLPPGKVKQDEFFGDSVVYYQGFDVSVPLLRANPDSITASFDVSYQGCADKGICYPPMTKTVQVKLPGIADAAAAPPEQPGGGAISEGSAPSTVPDTAWSGRAYLGYILTAFVTGILLTFTPCVLPMVPILSSIIVGQGEHITKGRGGLLASTYVLGTAVTYTVAGVVAGLTGEQLQAYFQNIWAIGAVSLILGLLALSMFGVYDLQMPSFIQSRLQDKTQGMQGGALSVVFVLGMVSALIVGACVSPLLIVALGVAIAKGDPVLGGAIMFAMALGMGVFLIGLGLGAGFLLPKAGAWMDRVKHVFGVLLLGVAIYLLGTIPEIPVLYLWGALLIIVAVYLGATHGLPDGASGWRYLWKGIGVFFLVWGVLALLGGMAGNRDITRPLAIGDFNIAGVSIANGVNREALHLFTRVGTTQDLDRLLTQARADGKPVLLDYYADWCVDCLRMEKATFTHPDVNRVLRDQFVLIQVDVTDPKDPNTKAMKRRFGVFGPPAMLFFSPNGSERKDLRRYGYMGAEEFLKHIARV
jgi:thiol:disulfide interchange protein DsbD